VAPVPHNDKLVATVQKTLQGVPVAKRYYDLFVNSLIDEKYNEGGDDVRANRKYPPTSLADVLIDKPDTLKLITSKQFQKEKRYKEVEGPYTEKGHYRVLRNVKEGATLLEREKWVVPLGPEETADRVPVNLKHLAEEYDQRYSEQWNDWLLDINVQQPATVKEAIELYGALTSPPRPYVNILRALEDGTQWKDSKKEAFENEELQRVMKQQLMMKSSTVLRGLRVDIDLKKIGEKTSTVPGTFRRTVEFGIPVPGSIAEPPLNKYLSRLEALRGVLTKEEDTRGPNLDPRLVADKMDDALKEAMDLLQGMDDRAKTIMTPLLSNPLKIVTSKLPPGGTTRVAIPPTNRWRR
jgi:type VI secretion system protein ImpL